MPKRNIRVRSIVLRLWAETHDDRRFVSIRIAEVFRENPTLTEDEREEIVITLHALIQKARLIDFALERAFNESPDRETLEFARYLCCLLITGEMKIAEASAALRGVDWPGVMRYESRIAAEPDPVKRMGLTHSMPDWLAGKLLEEYGEQAGELAASLNARPSLTLRVNPLKATRDEVLDIFRKEKIRVSPTALAKHGILVRHHVNVFETQPFHDGLFEVQDEGSQLVAELTAPSPGSVVVDFCAGAGGKTLALGAMMNNKGRLMAFDIGKRKLEELRRRARRAGLFNVQTLALDRYSPKDDAGDSVLPLPTETARLKDAAHRVLVDAPCSGVGAFRHNPEARWRLREEDFKRLCAEQQLITRTAMSLCKPGGRVVYSTCSVLREENERVVDALLKNPGPGNEKLEFKLVPLKEIIGGPLAAKVSDASGLFLKLLPHRHGTDGFFAAVMRREEKN